jgi:hypothetical protein
MLCSLLPAIRREGVPDLCECVRTQRLRGNVTMSLPFESSIRSLRADREWPALTVLVCAIVLLGLWMAWFLWAPIPRYETGTVVGTKRSGAIVAQFPAVAQTYLKAGQAAFVHQEVQAGSDRAGESEPVMVMLVDRAPLDGKIGVELASLAKDPAEWGKATNSNSPLVVDVEVEQLSPAQVVWRSSGQWIDTPLVRLSPQSR